LSGHEVDRDAAVRCGAIEELRSEWCDCHLIGAALRGERGLGIDVTARVMSALDMEPTVMAPKPARAE
jgi:negative regulator of sigma E activity